MGLEITKVKNSEGVVLEKQDMTNLSINLENGNLQLTGKHLIKRADGLDVASNSPAHLNISAGAAPAPLPGMPTDGQQVTESELAQIQTAVNALKTKIQTILNAKATIV